MKCFYHSDVDGKCAGAIVKKWWDDKDWDKVNAGEKTEYIMINYNDEFPFDRILQGETVYIVDYSLKDEDEYEKLKQITSSIVWIDHHRTAIDKHKKMGEEVLGARDIGFAGCELAWDYFFPGQVMPLAVKYAGRYDVWDFSLYGNILNEFQSGIRLYDHGPEDKVWEKLLWTRQCGDYPEAEAEEQEGMDLLNEILISGRIALKYRNNQYAGLIKSWSFWTEWEGYKCVCCNAGSVSSQLFDSVKEPYDLMLAFVFDGKQWTVSVYTKRKDIDCGALAVKYGGGGHRQAAGFTIKNLPFFKYEK
jgi:oligoribonuclease NrnB/cAMP/cGMP phosphodiesterase (DHH superfamily)